MAERTLNNADSNVNYQRDLAIQQSNAPIKRQIAAAMETPVTAPVVDRKNSIIESLKAQLQPTQRMPSTVATQENPLMSKGSVPAAVGGVLDPEKQLEDIAIKKNKGESLSESDQRFLFQQQRQANRIPATPTPNLGVQPQYEGQKVGESVQDYQARGVQETGDPDFGYYGAAPMDQYNGGQLNADQISRMSPAEMQAYQSQVYQQDAIQQKQLMEAQQREAQNIVADKAGRYQTQINELGTGLNQRDQGLVDQFKASQQQQANEATARTREAGLEQQANLLNSAARRGFSRSSTTEHTLQKASQNVIAAVADIENATGKAVNEYQAKLLDKQDTERQKLVDKLDSAYNEVDALKLKQLEEQHTLVKDLMKGNPSSPDNMIKLAKELATTRLAADKASKEDALKTFDNAIKYGFMPEAMSPEQQQILASNFGISVKQLPAIIAAAQKKEANKEQQVSYQTDLDGNVTAIVYDKSTGKFTTEDLGGIAKGEATRFQAIVDPITGQSRIFDPIHGVYVDGAGGKAGQPNFNMPTQAGQSGKVVISATTANTPANLRNNCVFFARSVVPDLPVGLITSTQKRNMINSKVPQAGAVAMMPTFGDPAIGHVAVVESVNADGTITLVEANVRSGANGKEISRRTGTPAQLKVEGYWAGKGAKASNYTTPKTSAGESQNANQTYNDVPGQMGFERQLAKGLSVDEKTAKAEFFGAYPNATIQDYAQRYADAQIAGEDTKAQVKAKETADKPLSDAQNASATYAQRQKQAEDVFNNLEKQGFNFAKQDYAYQRAAPTDILGISTGGFGKSDELKQQEQAERNFINATLRRESGAAISPSEFDSARLQYFPQPGDPVQVLAQKKQNRATAIQGMIGSSEGAYERTFGGQQANVPVQQEGEIVVRDKKTGGMGTISASEFDPSLYDKV